MTKARKARPRMAELPGVVVASSEDRQVSDDAIAQLQAELRGALERIVAIENNAATQIEQIQERLTAAEQSHQTQLHELTARFEALQHDKDVDRQDSIEKVIKLETEVDTLKKQLGQLIVLIKKRLT
jgi:phosphoribosylanthranilate isomerase